MSYIVSFRFHPADKEINNLLNEEGLDPDFPVQAIHKLDIYNFDPPQYFAFCKLNQKSCCGTSCARLTTKVQTQQLPIHHTTYNFRNHVAENSFSMVEPQQLPNHNLPFDSRNHVAENTVQGEELRQLPSHHLASDSRNHVAENILPGEEPQLLPNHHLSSDIKNHVAENTLPSA